MVDRALHSLSAVAGAMFMFPASPAFFGVERGAHAGFVSKSERPFDQTTRFAGNDEMLWFQGDRHGTSKTNLTGQWRQHWMPVGRRRFGIFLSRVGLDVSPAGDRPAITNFERLFWQDAKTSGQTPTLPENWEDKNPTPPFDNSPCRRSRASQKALSSRDQGVQLDLLLKPFALLRIIIGIRGLNFVAPGLHFFRRLLFAVSVEPFHHLVVPGALLGLPFEIVAFPL
jgi:hypothetical protein